MCVGLIDILQKEINLSMENSDIRAFIVKGNGGKVPSQYFILITVTYFSLGCKIVS